MSSPSRGPGTPGAPRERKVPHECRACVAPPPQPPWAELGRERPQERGLAFEQSPLGAGPDSVLTATPPDVTGAARRRVRDCSPAPSREGKAAGPPSRPVGFEDSGLPARRQAAQRGMAPGSGWCGACRRETSLSPCGPRRGHAPHHHTRPETLPGDGRAFNPLPVPVVTVTEAWQTHGIQSPVIKCPPWWPPREQGDDRVNQ